MVVVAKRYGENVIGFHPHAACARTFNVRALNVTATVRTFDRANVAAYPLPMASEPAAKIDLAAVLVASGKH